MVAKGKPINRTYIGADFDEVCELPDLIGIQKDSYENFLQSNRLRAGQPVDDKCGLEEVFRSIFPIDGPNGEMSLRYESYSLDFDNIKFSETECKKKGRTYSVPLRAVISLALSANDELREKEIFLGDIPLMTDRGTFIINGAERVVVSQIHRSPGVIFTNEKGVYSSRIIPYRGSWLEFEIDEKKHVIAAKIDRKKRILGTLFLRAIGYNTREKIIEAFYATKSMELTQENKGEFDGMYPAKDVYAKIEGNDEKVFQAGTPLNANDIEKLIEYGVTSLEVVDMEAENSLHSDMVLNCFAIEESKYTNSGVSDEPTKDEVLSTIYSVLMPGEMITTERGERELPEMFFSQRRYDLGAVGRYKLHKKFYAGDEDSEFDENLTVLTPDDIVNTMKFLIKVFIHEESIDDIDHLGNRRVRSVGELLQQQLKAAFSRMERIAKDRMNTNPEAAKPQDLISNKPVVAAIKEFFGSSQFSQFMDQINPLAELTHKRRLTALGSGGLNRDRAGFEVRDVHYTHYGRMCPIETPEGPNIGLIVSLANYTRINKYGFLETPYRKVIDGKVSSEVKYLDAYDEERYFIAQGNAKIRKDGTFADKDVPVRNKGDYSTRHPEEIKYMDVSPKQVVSVAASLIPFLEHDDANRALMGSNMQRQAVPLLFPEAPRVGTGMETKAAYDSGVLIKAKRGGKVTYVSSTRIDITVDPSECEIEGEVDTYEVQKFQRTNQDTCFTQTPIVSNGQIVQKGTVIADGPATDRGDLALGRNILVGFVPWNGYNYEDAVLISERVIKEDIYTSIHIHEFATDIRETKLGPEKLTRDIPNTSEKMLEMLDEEGIVKIGTMVHPGHILVGKVTPKSESDTTPEFKLLNSIFGEKAKEVRDTSLKVPHGTEGIVIDIQRLKKSESDELPPGVEETIKVLIATKRKLRQGDKMAGRHGNKGVVSRILPEEDMPFMEDGTPLDVCLNPLGVPSRMNIGQLMETQLGWAAVKLDEWYSSPVFQSATMEQIEYKMKEAGLPITSKTTLYDGRTGVAFVNPVFCGYIYYLKLHHLVDDKMHARSTGPYSLVTQQPLGGKAQFGGQRLGEMEVWALEAYGAANNLQELLTIKSDDMNGRVKIYESIVKGEPSSNAGMPEAFNVLVQEIRGLALDMSVYDSKGKQVALTERDEEIINKKGL
ncbi:MAG: DNA-directed RNA polymerase subunit beta [Sphaerochaetaceae bacterium]|nr:DNA-directed RNA polymerase subunit beta [Sphaerochaetaceae bacterium]